MPDTWKSENHVNATVTNSTLAQVVPGTWKHVAKQNPEEPCAVVPASTDLWEPGGVILGATRWILSEVKIPEAEKENAAYASYL